MFRTAMSWLMNPYHPWKLARTWLFSLFSSVSELWATMGVREAQDGKPWLLLDDMRNLVQSVSREGTTRRKWEGVVWAAMSRQWLSLVCTGVCYVCVCVCVCVRERERERREEKEWMCVCVQGIEIYVHVFSLYLHHASSFRSSVNLPLGGNFFTTKVISLSFKHLIISTNSSQTSP